MSRQPTTHPAMTAVRATARLARAAGVPVGVLLGGLLGILVLVGCDGAAATQQAGAATPAAASGPVAAATSSATDEPAGYLGVLLPSETVDVVAELAGRVARVAAGPGDRVEAGAVLASLQPADLETDLEMERSALDAAESALEVLEIEVRQAEQDARRKRALGELLSAGEVEAADFRLQAAEKRRDGARAALNGARARLAKQAAAERRSEVRAPFAGTVALRYADAGAVVPIGAPLFRLLGDGAPRIRFAVPPDEAAGLRAGDHLQVVYDALGTSEPPAAAISSAVVTRVAPQVDTPSGMVFAEALWHAGHRPPAGTPLRVHPLGGAAAATPPGTPPIPSHGDGKETS